MKNLRALLVSFVFGTAVTLALPIAALYGLVAYFGAALKWNKRLINKLKKYEHLPS